MTDAETGERGFIITGEDAYLEPYNCGDGGRQAPLLKDLRQLTLTILAQQKRLDALEPLVATRLDITKAEIDARRTNGFKAAQDMVAIRPRQEDHGRNPAGDRGDSRRGESPFERTGCGVKGERGGD